MSTLYKITNDGQMGEWRFQNGEDLSFSPPTFMETLLPSLVTAALTHFNESGLPVEAHFSHMALFQNIQERPADVMNVPGGNNEEFNKAGKKSILYLAQQELYQVFICNRTFRKNDSANPSQKWIQRR